MTEWEKVRERGGKIWKSPACAFEAGASPEMVRGWWPGRALPAADGMLGLVCVREPPAGSLPLARWLLGELRAICFHFGDTAGRLSSPPRLH